MYKLPKRLVTKLEMARELVKAGWAKGQYELPVEGKKCYCAMGAIRRSAGAVIGTRFELAREIDVQKLCEAVAFANPKVRPLPGAMTSHEIIHYNDLASTKKSDILKMFGNAIKKAK